LMTQQPSSKPGAGVSIHWLDELYKNE